MSGKISDDYLAEIVFKRLFGRKSFSGVCSVERWEVFRVGISDVESWMENQVG